MLWAGTAWGNLLSNPGFETGNFSGWTTSGNASIITNDFRSGIRAAPLADAEVRQGWVNVTTGKAYKAFAWVRIAPKTSYEGEGFRVVVVVSNWQTFGHTGVMPAERPGRNCFKVALQFTATTPTVLFMARYFGGSGRTQVVHLDDCALLEDAPGNLLPAVAVTLSPTNVVAPATQNYRLTDDDPDGAVTHVVWEFGDGTRAFGWSGARHVGVPGNYNPRVFVADDEGAAVSQQIAWSVTRAGWPSLLITNPASAEIVVSNTPIVFSGTATQGSYVWSAPI
ncbi:MAG: PKD domain-containing protein [Verrucomicrobiae bacterium]|nr:PKD domain-containing protein [Verrucomicrobiae bacterium]